MDSSCVESWTGAVKKRPEDDSSEMHGLTETVPCAPIDAKAGDLNRVMGRIAEQFRRSNPGVALHLKYQKGLWPVGVGEELAVRIVSALLKNAEQAMLGGGGDIYAETVNLAVEERRKDSFGLKPGHYVKLSITDTGAVQRVFMPFATRCENGGKKTRSTGLNDIYGIVSRYRGVITLTSKRAAGTTFSVYLPASKYSVGVDVGTPVDPLRKGTPSINPL